MNRPIPNIVRRCPGGGLVILVSAVWIFAALVAACGTTSGVRSTSGSASTSTPAARLYPKSSIPASAPTTTGRATNTGPGTGGLVTFAVEQSVMATTWSAFSTAFDEDNLTLLASVSTPSVDQVVSGYFLCGCGPWPDVTKAVGFSAPPQFAYPLFFLAEVQSQDYNQTPLNKEVVFTQSAAGRPWLVAYIGSYSGAGALFSVGTGTTDLTESPLSLSYDLSLAPAAFTKWGQQLDQTGTAPPLPAPFESTGISDAAIQDAETAHLYDQANGLTATFTHTLVSTSPVFPTPSGNLICATIHVRETVTSVSGDHIVQPTARNAWTAILPPRAYHTLSQQSELNECFLEWPTGQAYQQTDMGGFYEATGTA